MTKKQKRIFLITALILIVFFIAYSAFFRAYLDSEEYLLLAYEYTGRDPTIVDWEYPDFEVIFYKGRLTIHLIFHTTEDLTRGPIGLYIDPFRKEIIDVDPRGEKRSEESERPES
ncbi:MAG: hypothetical protein KBG64_08330 [Clostridia bacterium]|nr:hypothetical protein [Clostridia bacterium]